MRHATTAREHYSILRSHCLALLSYVAKHRGEWQTFKGLEAKCGVPNDTIALILNDARENGTDSLLFDVARRYGYEYRLGNRVGYLIDVEPRGPLTYEVS